MLGFYSDELFAPHPTPKLEYHHLAAVRDCLFNIFPATLHIGGRSNICNLRTCHGVVTGTHYIAYYDGFIITNDSEDVLSVCITNTTGYFLLDMFHS